MKNIRWFGVLTLLVAAVFILSLFSGIASAQKPAQKPEEQYEKAKEKYDNAGKKFEEAKDQFEKALKKLKNAKDKKSKDELKLKTSEYLGRAIDNIAAHLEVLKIRAEIPENKGFIPFDVSKNIEAHVMQLEQIRTKVQAANTTPEFKDAQKELKDLWVKIRLETRYDLEILLNHRMDNFIEKADNVSTRLNAAINNLKAQGKDTTKLEEEAANYKNLVKEAKDARQKTNDLFASHNGFAADGTVTDNKNAEAFLRQASDLNRDTIKKLKSASKQLRDFVRDFRKLSGDKGRIEGQGKPEKTPEITVVGTPTKTLSGKGTTTLSGKRNKEE